MADYNPTAMEERWQRAWQDARLFEPKAEEGRKKFYIIFAYPGISGYLHVGHMRGYTYCDAIARYHRQLGENVLFPAGFHASGIPAVSFARKVERGDEATIAALRAEGTPEEVIAKMNDPLFVVEFFKKVFEQRNWRRFGFSIDYTRLACTTDPGYSRFIEWQFRKLNERGLLVQKPHYAPFCPVSGPVAVDPSETDVSKGGDAEVLPFTALKFRTEEGVIYPCATLRPETVFGVTNLWVNPSANYVLAEVRGERWVLSPQALAKAELLFEGGVKEIGRVPGRDLVGHAVRAPVTGGVVRVFPSSFVDPAVGTGVVMSVPAHAPYDFQALEDLWKSPGPANPKHVAQAKPIVIIGGPGLGAAGHSPAERAVRAHHVKSVDDRAALDAATEEVYAQEFREGKMLENTDDFAGLSVRQARDRVTREATERGEAAPFPEFSKEVVCRCGQQVLIKRIPDQWFIRYSDEALTRAACDHARTMTLFPPDVARDTPAVLEWFSDRACTRQGAWLGTKFPLDERWIIEPISDSTLYPAYYIVAPFLHRGQIKEEALGDAFFDYVILGRGSPDTIPRIDAKVAESVRRDFLYWYPLDINLGGKEHKTVHFPAFIKNHVGLLAREHWPQGIFVHWWVTMLAGAKISKSKGGVEPIADLAAKYGVDALRLYYAHAAAPWLDVEWDPEAVFEYRNRLARILETVAAMAAGDLSTLGARADLPESATLDRWLHSTVERRLEEAREGWRSFDFRAVATPIYFSLLADLRWYLRRGGRGLEALRALARVWSVAMVPFTPHLSEELHHVLGGSGLASAEAMPLPRPEARDALAEFIEEYLQAVLDDTQKIRGVVEGFQVETEARAALEALAGKTVRGELIGRGEPLRLPAKFQTEVARAGRRLDFVFDTGGRGVGVEIKVRTAISPEAVEQVGKLLADGLVDQAWILALGGAGADARTRARELGVLLSGPAEFSLMRAESGIEARQVSPKRVTLITAPKWKADMVARVFEDARAHGKVDPGRVLKALAADAAFKQHMRAAPKVVQQAAEDAGQRKPEGLASRAKALASLDEYGVLREGSAFLSAEFGCPVEVLTGDNPGAREERLRGKADAAFPLRPAIAIEY